MKCGYCGGKLEERKVKKEIVLDKNVILLEVDAKVCQRCGTHFYPLESMRKMENLRENYSSLKERLIPVGKVFVLKDSSAT